MKRVSMLIALVAVAAVIALFVLGQVSQTGQAPGIVDGQLARCSERPNCVCSEYPKDARHFIAPLELSDQSRASAAAKLRAIITELGGTIKSEREDYIAATFTSRLFRFVDDLEIRFDRDEALIHFRSASRVGHSDLGANLKRFELLQTLFR